MTMQTFETKVDGAKRTKCEIWTRVMGYCRPVSNFNKGKKSEYAERKFFQEGVTMASMEGCCCNEQKAA